jgi:hypothetical protein
MFTKLKEKPGTPDMLRDDGAYVTIYQPVGGWNSVLNVWNDEGFWEPWQTGVSNTLGRGTREEAIAEAKSWAECEELPLYIP